MESYVKPSERIFRASYRLRPSTTTGDLSAVFMRWKSGCRYSFQSVTTMSASAPSMAS